MSDFAEEYVEYSKPDETNEERFSVTDIRSAEWCIKRIQWCEKKKRDAEVFVKAEKQRLDEYLSKVNSEQDASINYFTNLLQPFAEQELEGSRKRTLDLPSGKLSFRKQAPLFEVADDELMDFVKEQAPEYIQVTESVDWKNFKTTLTVTEDGRCVTEDGQLVPGVKVTKRPDSFAVKAVEENA